MDTDDNDTIGAMSSTVQYRKRQICPTMFTKRYDREQNCS